MSKKYCRFQTEPTPTTVDSSDCHSVGNMEHTMMLRHCGNESYYAGCICCHREDYPCKAAQPEREVA